ncbi:MAG: T9SS type A sorting domain-containing protein, partial [Bacteroidota bacterium]
MDLLLILLLLLSGSPACSSEKPEGGRGPAKPNVFEWKFLDGNRINCTIASDGEYADSRRTSTSGLEWPKGSGKTAIYTAGFWIVGKHVPSDSLRTANIDFATEYQPGPLLETFNTTTLDDTAPVLRAGSPLYRLYKINRGDTLSVDYHEWPVHLGAPYEDLDDNGTWDSGVDRPRFYGDQQIWGVINDVNNAKHAALGATPPMGIEVQMLFYVFDRPGWIENAMFLEWKIINKSDADYEDVYFGLWSDPDLGDANDDLPGSDCTLNLGYVYNGDSSDGTSQGYGATPPAAGFTLLAGPLEEGEPTDSARAGDRWISGYRNMPASSFSVYCGGTFSQLVDPPDGSPSYAPIAHSYLRGWMGTARQPLIRPDGSVVSWWFSGDPVTGTGDLPENFPIGNFRPQEIKMMLNSGPFALKKGETQYVAAALLISQGEDRLSSVSLLKEEVEALRAYYGSPPGASCEVRGRFLHLSSEVAEFEEMQIGLADTISIILSNGGHDTVTVTEIVPPSGEAFLLIQEPQLPRTLRETDVDTLKVVFSSQRRGQYVDSLLIVSTDSYRPVRKIALSGTGIGEPAALPGVMYGINAGSSLYELDPSTGGMDEVGGFGVNGIKSLGIQPETHILHGFTTSSPSTLHRLFLDYPSDSSVFTTDMGTVTAFAFSSRDTLYAGTFEGRVVRFVYPDGEGEHLGPETDLSYTAMAVNPLTGELWAAVRSESLGSRPDRMFKIDRMTGVPDFVGYTGDSAATISIVFDTDGRLYGLKATTGRRYLVRIDTLTGEGRVLQKLGDEGLVAIAMRNDTLRVVGVSGDGFNLPEEYALYQNYPNPFNPTTTIEFALPQSSDVSLRVFNVLGEEVTTLVDTEMGAGVHRVMWDASGMASGVYLYRLSAGNYVTTKKL